MSVQVPIPLIQHRNRSITGVKSAPDDYPSGLATTFMPIMLTFPDEGKTTGPDYLRIMNREYVVDTYVEPVKGSVLDDPIQETMELLDNAINYWTSLMDSDTDWVLDFGTSSGYRVELDLGKEIRDSGWRMDMEWEKESYYFGFRLWLPMMVRWGSGL